VFPGRVDPKAPWLQGDVVFVSDEDVHDPERVETWLDRVPVVVLTKGRSGFAVFEKARRHDFPSFETREIDPTGAGDVFAAAFLVRWHETGNLHETARFAAAAAALVVQDEGLGAVATRAEIEAVMAANRVEGRA
jgi:sugar/nucleoside kinase (ribokinase family)